MTKTVKLHKSNSGKWHQQECNHAGDVTTVVAPLDSIKINEATSEITIENVVFKEPYCKSCAHKLSTDNVALGDAEPNPAIIRDWNVANTVPVEREPAVLKKEDHEAEIECVQAESRPLILVNELEKYATILITVETTPYQLIPATLDDVKSIFSELKTDVADDPEQRENLLLNITPTQRFGSQNPSEGLSRQNISMENIQQKHVEEVVDHLCGLFEPNIELCRYESEAHLDVDEDTLSRNEITDLQTDGIFRTPEVDNARPDPSAIADYTNRNEIRIARHIESGTEIVSMDANDKQTVAENSLTENRSTIQFKHGRPISHQCDCNRESNVPCEHVTAALRNLPDISSVFIGQRNYEQQNSIAQRTRKKESQ